MGVAETIKASGMKCDELVYNTLMDGCVKANDLSAGVGLFAEMTQAGMKPSSITHSIFLRLYQRNGYKGNANEAVAQLYQHHGLERPSKMVSDKNSERGGKRGAWKGDRDRQRRQMNGHTTRGSTHELGLGPQQGPVWERAPSCRAAFPAPAPNRQFANNYQQPPQASLLGHESLLFAERTGGLHGAVPPYSSHCGDAAMRSVIPPCGVGMPSARRPDPLYGIPSHPLAYNDATLDHMPASYHGLAAAHQGPRLGEPDMMPPWANGFDFQPPILGTNYPHAGPPRKPEQDYLTGTMPSLGLGAHRMQIPANECMGYSDDSLPLTGRS